MAALDDVKAAWFVGIMVLHGVTIEKILLLRVVPPDFPQMRFALDFYHHNDSLLCVTNSYQIPTSES